MLVHLRPAAIAGGSASYRRQSWRKASGKTLTRWSSLRGRPSSTLGQRGPALEVHASRCQNPFIIPRLVLNVRNQPWNRHLLVFTTAAPACGSNGRVNHSTCRKRTILRLPPGNPDHHAKDTASRRRIRPCPNAGRARSCSKSRHPPILRKVDRNPYLEGCAGTAMLPMGCGISFVGSADWSMCSGRRFQLRPLVPWHHWVEWMSWIGTPAATPYSRIGVYPNRRIFLTAIRWSFKDSSKNGTKQL